jgi:hypothetical protein
LAANANDIWIGVARWFVFKPKITISGKKSRSQIGKCWYILRQFGTFYKMTIQHIVCSFGTFFRFWCNAPRKIWQPWFESGSRRGPIDRT